MNSLNDDGIEEDLFKTLSEPKLELSYDGQQFFVDYEEAWTCPSTCDRLGGRNIVLKGIDTGSAEVNSWLNILEGTYSELVEEIERLMKKEI